MKRGARAFLDIMALLLPQQSEVLFAYSVLADLAPGYTAFNDHQAYYRLDIRLRPG